MDKPYFADLKFIPVESISKLRVGQIIRNRYSNDSFVVTSVYGDIAIAVASIKVTNEFEWEVASPKVK